MEYILSKKYDTPELQALIMGPNPVKLEGSCCAEAAYRRAQWSATLGAGRG